MRLQLSIEQFIHQSNCIFCLWYPGAEIDHRYLLYCNVLNHDVFFERRVNTYSDYIIYLEYTAPARIDLVRLLTALPPPSYNFLVTGLPIIRLYLKDSLDSKQNYSLQLLRPKKSATRFLIQQFSCVQLFSDVSTCVLQLDDISLLSALPVIY